MWENCWSVEYADAGTRSTKDLDSLDSHLREALYNLQPRFSVLSISPSHTLSFLDFLYIPELTYARCCARAETLESNDQRVDELLFVPQLFSKSSYTN